MNLKSYTKLHLAVHYVHHWTRGRLVQPVFPFVSKLWPQFVPAEFHCELILFCNNFLVVLRWTLDTDSLKNNMHQNTDRHRREQQWKLFICWWNAFASIVLHDVTDILFIWIFLDVFVEKKHVSGATIYFCVVLSENGKFHWIKSTVL